MRDLAVRLIAIEALSELVVETSVSEAAQVCEKLRVSLTRFAGSEGFTALIKRAMRLARAEYPALSKVSVGEGGALEGFEEISHSSKDVGVEAAIVLTTHLLLLLITLVGESLTWRLVRDAWPEASLDS